MCTHWSIADASSERLSALAALTGLEALSLSRLRGYEDQWADLIRYPRLTSLELCGHANPVRTVYEEHLHAHSHYRT